MRRLTVINLGGGVQSSVMALMASEGDFDPMPDCAIFADTHQEPPSVYDHLEWLKTQLRFPLDVVDNGRSLREDVKALTNHSGSRSYVDIPRLPEGTRRRGRRHRQVAVHRQLQDQAGAPQCARAAGVAQGAADPVRRRRRAMAGHLHRRSHQDEGLPRQVDSEPPPAH